MTETSTPADKNLGGAPPGNQNYRKGKMYTRALKLALAGDRTALDDIVKKAIEQAKAGDSKAREHIAERLEGKAAQHVAITGANEGPLMHADLSKATPEELDLLERTIERISVAKGQAADSDADSVGEGEA